MNQDYITPNEWSIIENGFDKANVKSSESLFSLGNGAMGQRANFEEDYSGPSFQGSYIGGIYYPDKTRVGWWKNGYPEYFAKVLNAPNFIGIHITIEGEIFDLNTCKEVKDYKRELNMKEGWHKRSFIATLPNDIQIKVEATRFLSLSHNEVGVINYNITPLNASAKISYAPYIDAGITNQDSNWDDKFWNILGSQTENHQAFIRSHTMKTNYQVCTFMESRLLINQEQIELSPEVFKTDAKVALKYTTKVNAKDCFTLQKFAGYTTSLNHAEDQLVIAAKQALQTASQLGYLQLLQEQKETWSSIWEMSDISIDGDVKAQQGIRFNIFQLNQTYTGTDHRLNIGPKGFTGEKYGGSTYWDTEAYCLPFYMATKNQEVAKNLLKYRYKHLDKAIENAEKLGFENGAALYPMVTMNGEESHNEWEITFEEIHRNGAIAFAIFNYYRFTNDYSYIVDMGMEVLIAIARFWQQRATFSQQKNQYVILGVTGPNEYENNVNNNFYTNYMAKWCIDYMLENFEILKENYPEEFSRILHKTKLTEVELTQMKSVSDKMYFPFSEEHQVYLQQDGFLDKEMIKVSDLDPKLRPINQHWSWDRILRSPYIKQADTLQGFYFFEDHFSTKELERHFDFYEPFTVHESSLSPCVHSIQAALLNRMDQAYQFYLRTSRLDLDDYNKEVEEGCHITSMAGTWMSIVEGFGGMRVKNNLLHFAPKIPSQWDSYSFKVNFRNQILTVTVSKSDVDFKLKGSEQLQVVVNGKSRTIQSETVSA
ncbi:glycoside hydrolase family 65 protein [Psychroflexus sp. ALD_RP9]|uniref:glycoside hydrolase family 65 protein n=1 Tax=Psychroflexus sp. ALD_RP9 TaxID=2777186 RepID=UPI001A90045A|nr:glycoside hydrolase family 65 protein [Psychroflexus sp. ALD_RP9]QSS97286.1 glycoside hydrolase family 65 protein [Psychroflexus sp. ALD_RP9]